MAIKSGDFFSTEEKQRIEQAVREVEKTTRGEIVPMLAAAAGDYPRAEIIGGGCFALAIAALFSWWWWEASLWAFLPAFLLLYLPCKLLISSFPALKRQFISEAEMADEVDDKAMIAFIQQGLHHTREGTGILILICLFEHRVEVLADRGINALVPKETWQEIVAIVTDGLRRGEACAALCAAIGRCGEILADKFPAGDDNPDELPNLIIE